MMLFTFLLCFNGLLVIAFATYVLIRQQKILKLSIIIRVLFLALFCMVALAYHTSEQQFIVMMCLWVVFEAFHLKKLPQHVAKE
jgi:membrane glycosyltransferase